MILLQACRVLPPVVGVFRAKKLDFPGSKSNRAPFLVLSGIGCGICAEVSSSASHDACALHLSHILSVRPAPEGLRHDMTIEHKEPQNDDFE